MTLYSVFNKNVLILGLGISGFEAAKLALSHGAHVYLIDCSDNCQLEKKAEHLTGLGVNVHLGWNKKSLDFQVDLAIISPGIPPASSLRKLIKTVKCPLISELEFGFIFCSCPIIAVTGTNGKTTTVELITHCLKSNGKRVLAAGNNGYPLSKAARKSAYLDFIIVEVSSFQLEDTVNFAPYAAVFLNISDDHLDRYPTFNDYIDTKLKLLRKIDNPKKIIIQSDLLEAIGKFYPLLNNPELLTVFSSEYHLNANYYLKNKCVLHYHSQEEDLPLVKTHELDFYGDHNIENVQAVLAACQSANQSHTDTLSAIKTFKMPSHRQELVAVKDGVTYINDSKSTNPDSLIQALKTSRNGIEKKQGKVILIAGGRNKKMNFEKVIPYLRLYVKIIYLIGETKDYLAGIWGQFISCIKYNSLSAAVNDAASKAEPGDVIIFSPGCSSHDMFSNYEERGNFFIKEVKGIVTK